jgi:hypothetical protein
LPLDAVLHDADKLFDALGAPLDGHHVAVAVDDGSARQIKLLRVNVHLESPPSVCEVPGTEHGDVHFDVGVLGQLLALLLSLLIRSEGPVLDHVV